MTFKSF